MSSLPTRRPPLIGVPSLSEIEIEPLQTHYIILGSCTQQQLETLLSISGAVSGWLAGCSELGRASRALRAAAYRAGAVGCGC